MPTTRSSKRKHKRSGATASNQLLHDAQTLASNITGSYPKYWFPHVHSRAFIFSLCADGATADEAQVNVAGTSNDALMANLEQSASQTMQPKPPYALNDVELPPPPGVKPKHWCGWCSKEWEGPRAANLRKAHYFQHEGPWLCDLAGCWLKEGHDHKHPSNLAKHKRRHEERCQKAECRAILAKNTAKCEAASNNCSIPERCAATNGTEAVATPQQNQSNQDQVERPHENFDATSNGSIISLELDGNSNPEEQVGDFAWQSTDSGMFSFSIIADDVESFVATRYFTPVRPQSTFTSSHSVWESDYTSTPRTHFSASRTLFSTSAVIEICLCCSFITVLITLVVQNLVMRF